MIIEYSGSTEDAKIKTLKESVQRAFYEVDDLMSEVDGLISEVDELVSGFITDSEYEDICTRLGI